MEGIDRPPTAERNIAPSPNLLQSRPSSRRAKFTFGQFIRNAIHYRRPAHKRANDTGRPGFVLPGERYLSSLDRRVSHQSGQSVHTQLSRRSAPSIRSVNIFGQIPHVFVTQPTARGRRSRMIHRGSDLSAAEAEASSGKQLRYIHPTASAVLISTWSPSDSMSSTLSNLKPDSDSQASTSMTIDLASGFPGQVNVRKIARDSSLSFEDAKAVVDGVKPRHEIFKQNLNASSTTVYKAYNPHSYQSEDDIIHEHRQAALDALTGADRREPLRAAKQSLPPALVSGPPEPNLTESLSSSLTSTNGGATFFDDSEATKDEQPLFRPKLGQTDSSGFTPNSKILDRKVTKVGRSRDSNIALLSVPAKRSSRQSQRHRQLYSSVENFQESFPSFDEALSDAMLKAESERRKSALRSNVPKPHQMNENGFPIFKSSRHVYSVEPKYEKRTLSYEELKVLKKQEKRKSRLAECEKQTRAEPASFFGRFRKSLHV